jgi:hypothetical protein
LRPTGLPLMQNHAEMRRWLSHSCHHRGTRHNWQRSYLEWGSEIVIPKVRYKAKGSAGGYCDQVECVQGVTVVGAGNERRECSVES